MQKLTLGALVFLFVFSISGQMHAQTAPAPAARGTATVITAAEIQALAEKQPASTPLSDQLLRVLPINNGEYNVGVAIVHRAKVTETALPSALEHSQIAEVYYMLSGDAIDMTNGKMENPKLTAPAKPGAGSTIGPTFSDRTAEGGVSRELGPGDAVVIPPNTSHYFTEIKSDEVMYLVDRVDPHHVLAMPGQTPENTTGDPGAPGTAVDISAAEIKAASEQTGPGIVQVLRVVDNNKGEYNIAIALLHRTPEGDTILEHSDITEIYHIISGTATIETDGTIENRKAGSASPRIGPSFGGTAIRNGVYHEVGPGDVVVIPPNTPHYFSKVKSDKIVYLVVRVDPHHVLSMPPEDAAAAAKAGGH
jgi:mannose-6-phosphate isomerase-like protein (cupin superfamily)